MSYAPTGYGGHRPYRPGFFERLAIGWQLTKSSFGVIRMDKEILLLPVLSAIAMIGLFALTLGPFFFGAFFGAFTPSQPVMYALFGALYVGSAFVAIFFNVAIIHMATIRFQGGDPVVRDGLSFAWSRVGKIFVWAVFTAIVGMVIRALQERVGFLGQILLGGLQLAWNIATYFVVPILVYRDLGPLAAIKESAGIVRRVWGEGLAAVGSVNIIVFLLMIPAFLLIFGGVIAMAATGSIVLGLAIVAIGIVGAILVAVIGSALNGIVQSALYMYATTGQMPQAFDRRTVGGHYQPI